ncbi:MAG TPA: hypothetical protein VFM88_15200, partial [Vicinamibacteria bacterium]|nr:hypothetical protein [Vicinamibacteria bacterium]
MSQSRPSFLSRRARGGLVGLTAGLVLLLSGDRASTAIPQGIDPLDILKVLSRPNVFVALSTAGTMGDTLNSTASTRITLGGDHPSSKLRIAKDTIRQFVQDNQTAANFELGIYEQPAAALFIDDAAGRTPAVGGVPAHRFIYTSTDPNAASISANVGLASLTASGNLVRDGDDPADPVDVATDNVTDGAGTSLYRLWAGIFFNGDSVTVDSTGAVCSPTTPGTPTNPATVDVKLVSGTCAAPGGGITNAIFTFQGVAGDWGNPAGSCDGHLEKMALRPCTDVDQVTDIAPFLDPQLQVDTGTTNLRPVGYPSPDNFGNPGITTFGLLNGGFQPVAETLIDLKASFATLYSGTIAAITDQTARPRSIAIVIMDTDDTCSSAGTPSATDPTTLDNNALRAAHKAQRLYERIASLDPASSVPTFVIAYGGAVDTTRANWIAYGGSGMQLVSPGDTNPATQWPAAPTATDLANCPNCQVAYQAPDSNALYAAMLDAVAQAANTGEFSASPQVVSTV